MKSEPTLDRCHKDRGYTLQATADPDLFEILDPEGWIVGSLCRGYWFGEWIDTWH